MTWEQPVFCTVSKDTAIGNKPWTVMWADIMETNVTFWKKQAENLKKKSNWEFQTALKYTVLMLCTCKNFESPLKNVKTSQSCNSCTTLNQGCRFGFTNGRGHMRFFKKNNNNVNMSLVFPAVISLYQSCRQHDIMELVVRHSKLIVLTIEV